MNKYKTLFECLDNHIKIFGKKFHLAQGRIDEDYFDFWLQDHLGDFLFSINNKNNIIQIRMNSNDEQLIDEHLTLINKLLEMCHEVLDCLENAEKKHNNHVNKKLICRNPKNWNHTNSTSIKD